MVGVNMYILYDEQTLITQGASSSLPETSYIEISDEDWAKIEDEFIARCDCYTVDLENNTIIFNQELLDLKNEKKANYLTKDQQLAQENSQLQIELIMLRQTLGLPTARTTMSVSKTAISTIEEDSEYWYARLACKYANQYQINQLKELGVIV